MRRYAIFFLMLPLAAAQTARFETHVIASDLRGGYQVVAADLNHDGKPDLIALGQGMNELVWFENPNWERHVLATGFATMINCVVVEPGPEIVLASGFSNQARNSKGIVSVLRPDGDVRRPWSATEIDQLPTSHRLRLARIDDGRPVVVNAPLTGAGAEPPDYRGPTPLVYYRPGEWKRIVITEEPAGVAHGIFITDWDGNGRDDILTASFAGIHLLEPARDGRWTRTQLAAGDPSPWPKSGSSDIAVGALGRNRFLAAIEPWHGNQVVVYRVVAGKWARQILDDSFSDGHALLTGDFDGDKRDEIIAGYRARGNTYLYSATDASGERWVREMLDAGMASAACAVADLNGDGRPDVACIDATKLKWYENRPSARP
jgi:hypothetical protein